LFSDKKEDYHEWKIKTQAIADAAGYGETFKIPNKVIPTAAALFLSTATDEDKKVFKDKAQGVSLLILSTTKTSFGLVEQAKGNASDASALLDRK
jgi:hypothetical protein